MLYVDFKKQQQQLVRLAEQVQLMLLISFAINDEHSWSGLGESQMIRKVAWNLAHLYHRFPQQSRTSCTNLFALFLLFCKTECCGLWEQPCWRLRGPQQASDMVLLAGSSGSALCRATVQPKGAGMEVSTSSDHIPDCELMPCLPEVSTQLCLISAGFAFFKVSFLCTG